MNETVTFKTLCNRFEITVKKEALSIADLEGNERDLFLLLRDKHLGQYLHNTKGPAVKLLVEVKNKKGEVINANQYWLNGKRIPLAEGQKMEHDAQFSDKFNAMLDGQEI